MVSERHKTLLPGHREGIHMMEKKPLLGRFDEQGNLILPPEIQDILFNRTERKKRIIHLKVRFFCLFILFFVFIFISL